ncbi:MAG TPA: thiamine phosphate synthase [Candidatus Angelobacter sp.]|jgi:thiamine-phosphate pyrophosphorylase|nr:thiamine phosphate synthase [Candidatus Angelobacter sp.]
MVLQLYYITDRRQFPGHAQEQEQRLLAKIEECAAAGVEYIQLREKDLETRALEDLALKAMRALGGSRTRLLINSRTDVALACGAQGVHLPANDLAASEVRSIFARAGKSDPVIGVSTHAASEVALAEAHGASFAVFGPVFEKAATTNREGLKQLRQICHRGETAQPPMPVWALGGITLENAQQCVAAGAAGIAAIRLFQEGDVQAIVKQLRSLQA